MLPPDSLPITQLLQQMSAGDEEARARLVEHLYRELHERAAAAMRKQPPGHTLQASALVNEAYLKLLAGGGRQWVDRQHFISAGAQAMRQALVDHARRKRSLKRGVQVRREPLETISIAYEERAIDIEQLDEVLKRLAVLDPQMVTAVELRFFGDMPVPEVARTLGLSVRTFERRWKAAKVWIRAQMS